MYTYREAGDIPCSITLRGAGGVSLYILYSGVASNGALEVRAPSNFGNSVHSAASASLTVNISKITKEKHVLHFTTKLVVFTITITITISSISPETR